MTNAFSRLGFTMIELLVVIAVIGVLATVVLATLNPIEQINKSRDLGANTDAAQMVNALSRYFTSQEKFPWNSTTYCGASCATTSDGGTTANFNNSAESIFPGTNPACPTASKPSTAGVGTCLIDANSTWTAELTNINEVNETFISRIKNRSTTDQKLYIYKTSGTSKSVVVCYEPTSMEQKKNAVQTCITYKGSDTSGATLTTLGLPLSACPQATYTTADLSNTSLTGSRNELICLPLGAEKKTN